jgi:hypothetical protein
MFTPIKLALTALTITASLLTPISANAKQLTQEAGKEAMLRGKMISISEDGQGFLIEYRGEFIVCTVHVPSLSKFVFFRCYDEENQEY